MANLLEALQPKMEDTTSQLSTLLRAKSGKAVGGPATALSTQQEQAAVAQTAQAMQPVEAAAQTQAISQEQQAREVEQRKQQQLTETTQQRQANQMQMQLRTSQLLQELEQGKGKIDTARYQASMEQLGQNLRLSSKQYVDNLQREGARARIDDEMRFNEELRRSILQDNNSLLEKQLGNKSILAANDREFDIAMSRMGYDTALQVLRNELKGEKEQAAATGIGSIITAGIGAYGKYLESKPTASPSPTEKAIKEGIVLDNRRPGTMEA